MPERRTVWYDVPAGTKPVACRGPNCGVPMYWVETPHRSRVPVDCDVDGGRRPSAAKARHRDQADLFAPGGVVEVHDGRGVSHFTTCPDVDLFTKEGRAEARPFVPAGQRWAGDRRA